MMIGRHKRCGTPIFRTLLSNKEKCLHLFCAGVFLVLIWDTQNINQCKTDLELTEVTTAQLKQLEDETGLAKNAPLQFDDEPIDNEESAQNESLVEVQFDNKFKHDSKLKYILEVFGPKSDEASIVGTTKFRDCKSATNCYVTSDEEFFGKGRMDEFDAVVIKPGHLRADKFAKMYAEKERNPNQRYIFKSVESPRPELKGLINEKYFARNFFNWTWTYRMDSDITDSYGYLVKQRGEPYPIDATRVSHFKSAELELAAKTKLVFWAVSHCETASKRELYAEALQQFVSVDVYGKCGPLDCPKDSIDCFVTLAKEYKFYLAFENSLCSEYVTEKFWRTIRLPLVPIVMGGTDYKKIAPPNSFIDVNDFPTVEALANYLLFLDVNEDEYLSYFKWKDEYLLYDDHAYCQLCQKLNDPDEPTKVYEDLRLWWLFNENHQPFCTEGKNRPYYKSMLQEE